MVCRLCCSGFGLLSIVSWILCFYFGGLIILISVCWLLSAGYFRPGFGLPIIESDFGLLIILI